MLPERADNDFMCIDSSVAVLTRVIAIDGEPFFNIGYFSYKYGIWYMVDEDDYMHGRYTVLEWWPLPEVGSGNKC